MCSHRKGRTSGRLDNKRDSGTHDCNTYVLLVCLGVNVSTVCGTTVVDKSFPKYSLLNTRYTSRADCTVDRAAIWVVYVFVPLENESFCLKRREVNGSGGTKFHSESK